MPPARICPSQVGILQAKGIMPQHGVRMDECKMNRGNLSERKVEARSSKATNAMARYLDFIDPCVQWKY